MPGERSSRPSAAAARTLSRGAPCVLAAEVLEPNPAHAFYERVGYVPVAWCARIDAGRGAPPAPAVPVPPRPRTLWRMARLEATLAARRREDGDPRFDRPRAVDATLVGAIAAHLATERRVACAIPPRLVALDAAGVVRAAASFTVHALEPPFVPMRRALLGRFAVDPALLRLTLRAPLVALGCRLALAQGAPHVELTDLSAPGYRASRRGLWHRRAPVVAGRDPAGLTRDVSGRLGVSCHGAPLARPCTRGLR